MAKQHRMFTLTIASLLAALEVRLAMQPRALHVALAVIVAGAIVTAIRRTRRLARELDHR